MKLSGESWSLPLAATLLQEPLLRPWGLCFHFLLALLVLVWLLALSSKIKATKMSVAHSQSGEKVQESFLKNNDNNKTITIGRLEKFNFQTEITGEIVFSSGTEKNIPCSSRGHRLWQMAQPQQHKPFNALSSAWQDWPPHGEAAPMGAHGLLFLYSSCHLVSEASHSSWQLHSLPWALDIGHRLPESTAPGWWQLSGREDAGAPSPEPGLWFRMLVCI